MDYKNLIVERDGLVATVTLNRPEKLNVLSVDLMEEIIGMANEFHDDVETRAIVFAGAGKYFSAGMDLTDPKRLEAASGPLLKRQRQFDVGPRMIKALLDIDQITIAAIHGVALGGGACIPSALDFRIGTDDCRVGYPEINLGIPLSWVSLPLCVRLVGPARAKRMVILGQKEDAKTLLDWGFLDEAVPPDKLMDRAMDMAAAYAAKAPIAAQMIKKSVNAIAGTLDHAIMHMDSDQVLLAQLTEDCAEGAKAFFGKREPEFKGK